ncbi:MAG: DegT/DnrJ/EryC1/StrS family aminotransferase [Chloroflexi bacterium]|jgi:dTDP-4-amino-4,6-dideoxygalactose transaminase|nr:DegT/DnrJ/EryC1/StrS family aminotransferase [Chloroflexota bacterium]
MSSTLAIDGGQPLRSAPYPSWPQWGEEEERALLGVLRSGAWWAPEGSQVKRLEQEFAAYHDARHGVAVTNGSAALEVCLLAAGLGWGDEVITTPYTFIATANSALLVGAIPRFVDVLPDTWNMDPGQTEAAITPRTKAIMPVHIGGEPADMDAINAIAQRHGLVVIEDACQAHAATWQGRKVGAIGDMGCFSFQASKNITGGEGGLILTNDDAWAERCWSVVNVGRQRHGEWYHHIALASNFRLSEWAGAVLSCQLGRLEEQAERRSANAAYLADALQEVPGLSPVPGDPRVTRNAYHLFKIWYDPRRFGGRPARDFAAAIRAEGVPITAGYGAPLSAAPVVVERTRYIRSKLGLPQEEPQPCPVAVEVCDRGLWLRQSALLAETDDMDDVVRAALKIQNAWQG